LNLQNLPRGEEWRRSRLALGGKDNKGEKKKKDKRAPRRVLRHLRIDE